MTKPKEAPRCAYGHDSKFVGACDGPLIGRVAGYFANGGDLVLCRGHIARWNALHRFGPIATGAPTVGDTPNAIERWTCKPLDGDDGETCGMLHRTKQTAARHMDRIGRQIPGEWVIVKIDGASK